MRMAGSITVREVAPGKDGSRYVMAFDKDNGGDVKLVFPASASATADSLVGPKGEPKDASFEAVVRGRLYERQVFYVVQEWRLTPAAK